MCWNPAWHAGQVPSQARGITVTASPAAQPSTPAPDRLDRAGHLVPEDERTSHARIHVAPEDVEVGAAQSDVGNADLNLTVPGLDGRDVVVLDGALGYVGGTAGHEGSSPLRAVHETGLANIIRMP